MRFATAWGLAVMLATSGVYGETLREVYDAVLQSDPTLLAAYAANDVEKARSRQQLAELLPQVSGNASFTRNRQDYPGVQALDTQDYNGKRYLLSLQQPLFDVAHYRGYLASRSDVVRSTSEAAATLAQVSFETVTRYLDTLTASEQVLLSRQLEAATARQHDQVAGLYAKQLVKVTDLLQLEARLDLIKAERISAETDLAAAFEGLAEFAGRPIEQVLFLAPDARVEVVDLPAKDWIERAVATNDELRARRQTVDSANLIVAQRQAARYPTVSLQATGQNSDIGYEYAQQPRTESAVLGLNITLPIYAGGAVSASIAEASAQVRVAQLDYERTLRRITKDINDAVLRIKGLDSRIAATRSAVSSSEKSLQAVERAYHLGVQTLVDVLNAREDVFRARNEFAKSRYDLIREWSRLNLLAGTAADAQVYEVSALLNQADLNSP